MADKDGNMNLYRKLNILKETGGGKIENASIEHNADASMFIFDKSIHKVIQYEANPIQDLTSQFTPLALAFSGYVKSGLPFHLVMPDTRKRLEEQKTTPLVIEFFDKFKPKNMIVKVANDEFKKGMTKILKHSDVDYISGDYNSYTRVSKPEDCNKANVGIFDSDYEEAWDYFNNNFSTLSDF